MLAPVLEVEHPLEVVQRAWLEVDQEVITGWESVAALRVSLECRTAMPIAEESAAVLAEVVILVAKLGAEII